MTPSAWITMAITMSVVTYFAGRFFLMVLRAPPPPPDDPGEGPP